MLHGSGWAMCVQWLPLSTEGHALINSPLSQWWVSLSFTPSLLFPTRSRDSIGLLLSLNPVHIVVTGLFIPLSSLVLLRMPSLFSSDSSLESFVSQSQFYKSCVQFQESWRAPQVLLGSPRIPSPKSFPGGPGGHEDGRVRFYKQLCHLHPSIFHQRL